MNARALSGPVLAFAAALGTGTPALASAISLAGSVSFVGTMQPANGCTAGSAGFTAPLPSASKASAILGGGVSQLDRIRQEQLTASAEAPEPAATKGSAWHAMSIAGFRPAPGAPGIDCARLSAPRRMFAPGTSEIRSDDYLMSRRLAVRHTAFDRQWDRVRTGTIPASVVRQFSQAEQISGGALDDRLLAAVNGWTNHRIRYEEDSRLYKEADYWASAQSTFRRGAGDCEDIAIAKLQLLAKLGVPQSDMFLTIARDLARNADHALLIVRRGDRYWLLDNGTDRVLDASANYDYRPIMSFSGDRKWLHGFATAQLGLN